MIKLGADKVDIPSKNNKENAVENYADVDVIAIFEKLKHIIYIQAKFHNGKTSDWAVLMMVKKIQKMITQLLIGQ